LNDPALSHWQQGSSCIRRPNYRSTNGVRGGRLACEKSKSFHVRRAHPNRRCKKAWLLLLTALVTIAACSSLPPIRYYTLSAESAPSGAAAITRPARAPYTIDAVSIPDFLDRPQIVLRTSTKSVEMLEYDRWAAPLPDQIERVMAADLSARLGPGAVIDPGLPTNSQAKRRITVSILGFDPSKSGESSLEASWVISDAKSGSPVVSGPIFRTRHVATTNGPDVMDIVGTMSGLVTQTAADIATTIAADE
jgi:hypothetical protein